MSFEAFLGELRADAEETKLIVPPGAVDCDLRLTSLDGEPAPVGLPEAPPSAYREVQDELGLSRAVLFQEDGIDIDLLLKLRDALTLSPDGLVEDCVRTFVTLSAEEDPVRLAELAEAGISGMRVVMLRGRESVSWDALDRHVRRVHDLTGWNREIAFDGSDLHEIEQMVRSWPGETILADLGGFRFSHSLTQPGFRALRRLIDRGRLWVKLSAPHRIRKQEDADGRDIAALASALVDWAPERMVWGSGWPFLDWPEGQGESPDGMQILENLRDWVMDGETQSRILRLNPEELFGFKRWPVL